MEVDQDGLSPEDIKELRQKAAEHLWIPYTHIAQYEDPDVTQIFVGADGIHITDAEGKSYIDAFSGLMYKNVGHGRQEIVDAVTAQMQRMPSAPMFHAATLPAVLLAAKLAEITPGSLSRVHYVNSGSEANDLALRLSHQHTGQKDVITLDHAYHGHVTSLIDISPYKFDKPGGK